MLKLQHRTTGRGNSPAGVRERGLVTFTGRAVTWLRRLVTGLSPCRPRFDPRSVHEGFMVDKVTLGKVFPPSTSVFPCQFHSTGTPLHGKMKKLIFITGLHNKLQDSGASVASAVGPSSPHKKKSQDLNL
jgi:hypothetical protein